MKKLFITAVIPSLVGLSLGLGGAFLGVSVPNDLLWVAIGGGAILWLCATRNPQQNG